MKRFMATLRRNKSKDLLLERAAQLCRELQGSPPALEQLAGAVHSISIQCCRTEEKEKLVRRWHEIHYWRFMEKHHKDFLTPVQKFCCKRRYQ
ncbi:hypothetical protein CIB84_000980, partial [Bambusicola thoracicus]